MAAEDSDLEKTEPASQRRLEQAREEGDIPRSRELAACASLLAGGLLLWMMGSRLQGELSGMLREGLAFPRELAFEPYLLLEHGAHLAGRALWALLPFAAILLAVVIAAPLLVGGWLFSVKSFLPRFDRLDPVAGITRMFSLHSLGELGKAVAKAVLLGVVGTLAVMKQTDALVGMAVVPAGSGDSQLGRVMFVAFAAMAGVLALIAAIDVPWQRWKYAKKLMMTREQARQEHKEQEGNPEIKGRIRAQQREMARRRMMAEVPKADVVVTNPTHFAVALRYSESRDAAPVVVAKGVDELAAKIREIAAANNVPLLEAPPLARALYRHVEPGEAIPEKLYTAVAQVLAWVFQLRAGYRADRPTSLEVPDDMDIPPHLRSAGVETRIQAGDAA
ncbi:MAG: FlhB flagellar biosynthetic protein [Pseudomonadota bacterium]